MNKLFREGDFVKWSSADDQGPFSYIGHVIEQTETSIQFLVNDGGVIEVSIDDGTFEHVNRPKDWRGEALKGMTDDGEVKITPDSIVREKKITKTDQAVDLLRDRGKMSRKEAIQVLVDAGLSTPAGASTHFNNAKKVLGW